MSLFKILTLWAQRRDMCRNAAPQSHTDSVPSDQGALLLLQSLVPSLIKSTTVQKKVVEFCPRPKGSQASFFLVMRRMGRETCKVKNVLCGESMILITKMKIKEIFLRNLLQIKEKRRLLLFVCCFLDWHKNETTSLDVSPNRFLFLCRRSS